MSSLLARLARALTHHWGRGLIAAIVIVALLGAAAGAGEPSADDFSAPGTETQKVLDLLKEHSPAAVGSEATVVFTARDGKITDGPKREAVTAALATVKEQAGREGTVSDPFAARSPTISRDGTIAAAEVSYAIDPADLEKETGEELQEAVDTVKPAGIDVSSRGIVVDVASEPEAPIGELVGVLIAVVLLTILFRSGAAMAATIIGALLGVMVGQILLIALAKPLGLPEFASIIAVMLGLGAGIDYALLIIARYREQIAEGDSVRDASAKAAATSGSSVVAAGLIVMVAIAGLLVIGIPLIGKMGVGAAIGVAAVVVSALTVLPIMIGALQRWLTPKKASHVAASPAFARWAERITARPWLSIAAGVIVLLIFAAPVTQMRLGQPDDGNQPESKTQRVAYDQLSKAFGPGYNGRFLFAIDVDKQNPPTPAQLAKVQAAIANTPGMVKASVTPAMTTPDGEAAISIGLPTSAPQDTETSETLSRLRDDVIPAATKGTPLESKFYVGGNTAGFEDFSDKVASRLPLFIALVIGLSVLLLTTAFRSLWVPLVSAVFNLLSVGAAYGVVVAVFQEGFGASLLGVESGVPIVSFVPVMIFAILFGLSMDYNVFLLSRIHEAHNEGAGPRESVIVGVSRIGKVILFAGLIMAAVFLAFVSQPDVTAKIMGLGLGLAILIDVLIVRLVIAPAVVMLLGDKAWWLPAWLDRILPNVSLEGHLVKNEDPKGEPLEGIEPHTGHGATPAGGLASAD